MNILFTPRFVTLHKDGPRQCMYYGECVIMRTACIRDKMRETIPCVCDNLIPQLRDLRRIPMRYQSVLPLKVMKRYQCAVVGSAQGVLTVAITNRLNTSLIKTFTRLIGRPIFPVWVKPARMGLLIKRMERWERREDEMLRSPRLLSSLEIHVIVSVLTDQMKEKK